MLSSAVYCDNRAETRFRTKRTNRNRLDGALSFFCSLRKRRRDGVSEGVPQTINKRRYTVYTAKICVYFFSLIPKRLVTVRDCKLRCCRFILCFSFLLNNCNSLYIYIQ